MTNTKSTKTPLRYDLSELNNTGHLITITAKDKEGREASIVTSSTGGKWYWSENERCYKQTLGTAQYKIRNERHARQELRKEYEEMIKWEETYKRISNYDPQDFDDEDMPHFD